MKKILCFLGSLFFACTLFAQVGINTVSPQATLHVSASDEDTPSKIDGILIPKINKFPATNPEVGQHSMLVYLTKSLTGLSINGTVQDYPLGFYYWNNDLTNWIGLEKEEFRGWKLDGNDDAVSTINFIGTTVNEEVDFRVDNTHVARLTKLGQFELEAAEKSIFIGLEAGESYDPVNTSSEQNVFIGHKSGNSTSAGRDNVAIGTFSLEDNVSGNFNTGVGDETLQKNSTGYENTAIGNDALRNTTTGGGNTGIGARAGINNTGGFSNVFIGHNSNAIGGIFNANVAIGSGAIVGNNYATTIGSNSEASGFKSTAIGSKAKANTNSVAVGEATLATGEESIAMGNDTEATAKESIAIGSNAFVKGTSNAAIAIGHETQITGPANTSILLGNNSVIMNAAESSVAVGNNNTIGGGVENVFAFGNEITIDNGKVNSVGIGFQASPTVSNQIRLGNTDITNIMGQVAITTTSDARFKEEVMQDIPGLNFITELRPVSYVFNKEKLSAFLGEKAIARSSGKREVGFLAQEVEDAARLIDFDFSAIKSPSSENDLYGLSYATFVVPLVKAVQEQQEQIEDLKKQVAMLKQLTSEVDELKAMMIEITQNNTTSISKESVEK